MDQDIIDVARIIRRHLPELVGDEAGTYENEIKDLLAQASNGIDVSDEIMAILSRPKVKERAEQSFNPDPPADVCGQLLRERGRAL